MKLLKAYLFTVVIAALAITLQSCKAKKLAATPPAPVAVAPTPTPQPVAVQPKPVDQPKTMALPPPVAKPNYNFSNVQFEFDSGILRTASYPILDKAAVEMKKDPSVKFILKGYASIEGTPKHNMELSEDRANSVKTYLVNSGISTASIITKGYGTNDPIGDNNTETGKVLNRRVEIHLEK